jgi:hypothetical protein
LNINPNVDPYVCLRLNTTAMAERRAILDRRNDLIDDFNLASHYNCLEDPSLEDIARLNALAYLTGETMGDLISDGKGAKETWSLFAECVQQIVTLYMLEKGE